MVLAPVLQKNDALRVFTREGEVKDADEEEVPAARPSRSRQYDLNGNLKCGSLINLVLSNLSKGPANMLFSLHYGSQRKKEATRK